MATPVAIVDLWQTLRMQGRIMHAIMLREVATRFGRDNASFLWLSGEPLTFCLGVLLLWHFIKPPFEHGIPVLPFAMSGYLPLIMLRHMTGHSLAAVKANTGLLYHRQITILQLFFARLALEFVGITIAFLTVYMVLFTYGIADPPKKLYLLLGGWFLMACTGVWWSLILGALAQIHEIVERVIPVLTYILIPIAGTFFLADWVPPAYRHWLLMLPFIHCTEMIRAGIFGNAAHFYYNPPFVLGWALVMTVIGLLFTRFVRESVDVD